MRLHGKVNGGDHSALDQQWQKVCLILNSRSKWIRSVSTASFGTDLKWLTIRISTLPAMRIQVKTGEESFCNKFSQVLDVQGKLDLPNNSHPHVALAMILRQQSRENSICVREIGFEKDEISDVVFA